MRSLLLKSGLVLLFLVLSSCTTLRRWIPFLREEVKPHVTLAHQDRSAQMIVLIRDLELPVRIERPGPMPFTQNSHAVLIVGHAFPYEKLSEILEFVRNYYTDLHYVKVTSPLNSNIPYEDHTGLFIGGSTDRAVQEGLVPWNLADFDQLRRVQSQEEMVQLIKSKNEKK